VLGTRGRTDSYRLGVAVFGLLGDLVRELLATRVSLIVEGNFVPGTAVFDNLPAARVVQVHATATPELLRDRLLTRDSHRHPVHYDREVADEIAARAAQGEWAPLGLEGVLIEVDTSNRVDETALVERVRTAAGL
jgi:hypothetical protein